MTNALTPFAYHERRRAPYLAGNVTVVPVTCKTGLGVSRRGALPHRIESAAAILSGDRMIYAARWLCGAGCRDVTFLASTDAHGGAICIRCQNAIEGNFVYRCFASDGRLLYIGSTSRYGLRITSHRSSAPWWAEVADVIREPHESLSAARAAERLAIQSEGPAFNRQWVAS